jgi:hypothetical protein
MKTDKKTSKMTIEISSEVHEKLKVVQDMLKEKGVTVPLANIVSNFLEKNKDSIKFEM